MLRVAFKGNLEAGLQEFPDPHVGRDRCRCCRWR